MQPSRPESDPPARPGDAAAETVAPAVPATAGDAPLVPRSGPVIPGFELLGEISRGGMGAVYKARQKGIERLVALKVILPDRMGSADAVRRFKREARAAALLNHPNIVTIYATDLDGPVPYLAMEYIDGIDLQRLIVTGGRLSVADALRYILQAAQALEHAHEQGLVHRDIKPANLMLVPSPLAPAGASTLRRPRVKLLDLGLARVADTADNRASCMTADGALLGTPDYMAPEQAADSRSADVRSDIYGLGGVLYYLLTGQGPLGAGSVIEKLHRLVAGTGPKPLGAARPDAGAEVEAIVRRMLAADPKARYQTPSELILELERALQRATSQPAADDRAAPAAPFPSAGGIGRGHAGAVTALAVGSDGLPVTGGADGTVRVWDAVRLVEAHRIAARGAVEGLVLVAGGRWAATCSLALTADDAGVVLWDLSRGGSQTLRGPTANPVSLAVSLDGRRLAAGCADGTAVVWELGRTVRSVRLEGHPGRVNALVFSSGNSVLTAGDAAVRKWDIQSAQAKGTLRVPVGRIAGLAVDGATGRLAVAGEGLMVRQPSGELTPCRGHDGAVSAVAFSPDGTLLASGGADGTVRLWRVETGEQTASVAHQSPVTCVGWAPDGKTVYSGGTDGTVRRWA